MSGLYAILRGDIFEGRVALNPRRSTYLLIRMEIGRQSSLPVFIVNIVDVNVIRLSMHLSSRCKIGSELVLHSSMTHGLRSINLHKIPPSLG